MKYYVSEVTRYKEPVNGKDETFSMNAYDEQRLALATYHQKMSTAMKNDNVILEIVDVKSEQGVMIINPDVYQKPIEPVVTEESTEE